ncbi:MAG: PorT family protein [Bacteroidales bacterium]|nr:PorT family protein [Bacteroidales bacterium]
MKIAKRAIIAIIAILCVVAPASAQFRWGIKAGVNVSSLHFSKDIYSDVTNSNNRTGFTGGLMAEFTVPVIGIAMDASVLYTRKIVNFDNNTAGTENYHNDYIEIPINLKYKFSIPVVSNFLLPYLYTGPSFAFLTSKKAISDAFKNKTTDVTWNLGLGLQLVSHLQISAQYGWGINKATEFLGATNAGNTAKTNGWTVTAAYLF